MARTRVAMQIKNDAMDGNWTHPQILAEIADFFARPFTMMGNCRFPPYTSKEKAEEWLGVWRLINEQRMKKRTQKTGRS